MVLLLILAACGGKDSADEADENGGGGDSSSVDESIAPRVESVSASCAANVDDVDMWSLSAQVSDPQDDVASQGGTVAVLVEDTEYASYDLACGGNACVGSWTETQDGIDCTVGESATFRVVAIDREGNESAPYDYTPG